MRTGTRSVVLGLLISVGLVCLPGGAEAQATKQLTIIPIKFQDDQCEGIRRREDGGCTPITREQHLAGLVENADANSTTLGNFLRESTNGLLRLNVTVHPYVTVAQNKPTGFDGSNLWNACTNGTQSWSFAARQAAGLAGYALTGDVWVYSPQTWGHCSHKDVTGVSVHEGLISGSAGWFLYASSPLGLSSFMPAWDWICRDLAGGYVTFSPDCQQGIRTFMSLTGQGSGSFTVAERVRLGTMPNERLLAIPVGAALPRTIQLAAIDRMPAAGAIQGVIVDGMGLTLEYHAPSRFGAWQTDGISAHPTGTSRFVDFSPDALLHPPSGSGTLKPGMSYVHPSGLRLRDVVLTATGVTFTLDQTTPPTPATCPVSPQGAKGLTVIVQEGQSCANYRIDAARNGEVYRNDLWTQVYAQAAFQCAGIAWIQPVVGADSYRQRVGSSWAAAVIAPPAGCLTTTEPIPPPPPPPSGSCTAQTVTDVGGNIFEIRANRRIFRNGVDSGGAGDALYYFQGRVYTRSGPSAFYVYDERNGWGGTNVVPSCEATSPPPPPPPPTPTWAVIPNVTVEQLGTLQEWRLTLPSGVVVVIPKP